MPATPSRVKRLAQALAASLRQSSPLAGLNPTRLLNAANDLAIEADELAASGQVIWSRVQAPRGGCRLCAACRRRSASCAVGALARPPPLPPSLRPPPRSLGDAASDLKSLVQELSGFTASLQLQLPSDGVPPTSLPPWTCVCMGVCLTLDMFLTLLKNKELTLADDEWTRLLAALGERHAATVLCRDAAMLAPSTSALAHHLPSCALAHHLPTCAGHACPCVPAQTTGARNERGCAPLPQRCR